MKTFLIILVVLALIASVYVYLIKKGKIKDDDHDYIPDVVEDKVSEIKETVGNATKEVKSRAKRIKEELDDVASAARNLTNQTGDIIDAVKGTGRKGRKPKE